MLLVAMCIANLWLHRSVRVCEGADGADVSGAKTMNEYSADQPAETLGVAGSSLLCSGSDLTAPPLIMLHL